MAGEVRVSDRREVRRRGGWEEGREEGGREGGRGRMLGRGRLDDRPQVAQRLKLVRVDHATIELDGYGLRNGAHSRVGGWTLPGAQNVPRAQGMCVLRPKSSS